MTMNVVSELDFAGVYRVSPDLGTINCIVRDFVLPNGLASPPTRVSSTSTTRAGDTSGPSTWKPTHPGPGHGQGVRPAEGGPAGRPRRHEGGRGGERLLHRPGGVWIFDPTGNHLGTVLTGAPSTTNVAWGGDDWTTLFITSAAHHGPRSDEDSRHPVPRPGLRRPPTCFGRHRSIFLSAQGTLPLGMRTGVPFLLLRLRTILARINESVEACVKIEMDGIQGLATPHLLHCLSVVATCSYPMGFVCL